MGHGGALSMPAGVGGGETRLILRMHASIDGNSLQVLLQLDDHMNRQLTTEIGEQDTAENLVIELVQHGFISETDSQKMCSMLTEVLEESRNTKQHRLNSPT
uniref:Uncharacterized protein n=1 Tax=Ditylenchus dipsaci TaxID=166011 RepID=A0A915EE26_9BILA